MKISNRLNINNGLKKKLINVVVILVFLLIPSFVWAQGWVIGPPPAGLPNDELDVVLENIIVGILGFIGILGILYLVYGSIRYVTSAGNDSDMEEAKTIIMYAIWGLFITASAYAIVRTVVAFTS